MAERLAQLSENDKPVVIYTTFPSAADAEAAAARLVDAGLVACANILPGMRSVYRWQGRREAGEEVVMILKTSAARADTVVADVAAHHPYDCPAALVLPVVGGFAGYLAWIAAETR